MWCFEADEGRIWCDVAVELCTGGRDRVTREEFQSVELLCSNELVLFFHGVWDVGANVLVNSGGFAAVVDDECSGGVRMVDSGGGARMDGLGL